MAANILRKATAVGQRLAWSALRSVGLTPKRVTQALGTSALSADQQRLLEEMRRENALARPPFRATEIWKHIGAVFEDAFHLEGIRDVESQQLNRWFASPAPADPKLLRYASWMLYQNIKRRDSLDLLSRLSATVGIGTGYAFEFEGHVVSWDLLISLDSLYAIAEAYPEVLTESLLVAEIGAGWGRMAPVLKAANPRATFAILDLPETLLVSSTYLPRVLPNERVLSYRESRSLRTLDKASLARYGIVFLAAQDLERFADGSIDVLINIASFQEMTREQLAAYFAVIDRKLRGALYTLQLWRASTHAFDLGEVTGFDDYPFPTTWKRRLCRNASWSDLYFEAVFEVGEAAVPTKVSTPGVLAGLN
jgi:putative sugar O-methyltransferase